MGESYYAVCAECGTESEINVGGGFFFHLFRCNRCGKERSANFDELRALHEKHLKGYPGS